ncbi:unnamed protein product [Ectocarpus sp. 6 AP-2014]
MCASTDEPSFSSVFLCKREQPTFVSYVLRLGLCLGLFLFGSLGRHQRSACMPSTFVSPMKDKTFWFGCLAFICCSKH